MTIVAVDQLDALTCIDDDTRLELINNSEQQLIPANQQIIRENDTADCMYIIVSGKVSIYITDESGQDLELGILSSGAYFGEQAILSGGTGRRNASVKTLEATELTAISKPLFQSVVDKTPKLLSILKSLGQNQLRHRLMQESHLFRSIHLGISIQHSISEASFSKNDVIYQPGDNSKWFYLVLWGVAEVFYNKTPGQNLIRPGDFFGAIEIINSNTREHTAIAKTELLVLKIEGNKFLTLFKENPSFHQLVLRQLPVSRLSLTPASA